jgi:hypothetical protein
MTSNVVVSGVTPANRLHYPGTQGSALLSALRAQAETDVKASFALILKAELESVLLGFH